MRPRPSLPRPLAGLARAVRRAPADAALALVVVAASIWVVAYPLAAVRYPAITDLPFHGAHASALLHYDDPAWHFREQFRVQPLAVPYLSMYALGALFMSVLPPLAATKLAAAVMLALLPAGLAVLFRGMKRTPLLGVLGLGLVWSNLTHWGFLNFMGALGLFAMVVGLTMRLVERPSAGRQLALALALVALFFTHIFRFPFALCAVACTALVLWPATRRLRPVALPLAPALGLFALWLRARPAALRQDEIPLEPAWERLGEIPALLFSSFTDPAEAAAAQRLGQTLVGALLACVLARLFRAGAPAYAARTRRALAFAAGAALAPIACAVVFLGLFLVLPLQMGLWWYVYPREATAALFLTLAAFPDLPRAAWIRAPIVVALSAAAAGMASVVADNYRRFDESVRDFDAIVRQIPQAPKLLYLIYDHRGSTRTTTPYIHLPAWVQAERGGWLSFHFAVWSTSPLAYRSPDEPGAVVPPPTPLRWEWTPHKLDLGRQGPFFDWFLVRNATSPDHVFRPDPTIERVDHVGAWWLYRRVAPPR